MNLESITLKEFEQSVKEVLLSLRGRGVKPQESSLKVVDYFLNYWLEDIEYYEREEDLYPYMDILFYLGRDHYLFSGTLYRGISSHTLRGNRILRHTKYASYSSSLEIGKHFAGLSEKYGISTTKNHRNEVFKLHVSDAFAFDGFLSDYCSLSLSDTLRDSINKNFYEAEKIYSFHPSIVTRILDIHS